MPSRDGSWVHTVEARRGDRVVVRWETEAGVLTVEATCPPTAVVAARLNDSGLSSDRATLRENEILNGRPGGLVPQGVIQP